MARFVDYDYLVIATGPDLAFDEIEGSVPAGNTDSICQTDHAVAAARAVREVLPQSTPDRGRRGPGRVLLRPRLRDRA